MALFQHKKTAAEEAAEKAKLSFDKLYREELQKHGREYFDKILDDNAVLFKKDLDAAITTVHQELKDHLTKRLDDSFGDYEKMMKAAQDQAMDIFNNRVRELQEKQEELAKKLEKSIELQEASFNSVFEKGKTNMGSMNDVQAEAVKVMTDGVQALKVQQQTITDLIEKGAAEEKNTLVTAFETNMARIVEHYVLGALGDQYDLKAQLPAIMKELEANKTAIVDDMTL